MNDPFLMRRRQGFRDLQTHGKALSDRQRAIPDTLGQSLSGDVFQNQVGAPVGLVEDIIDGADMGVAQAARIFASRETAPGRPVLSRWAGTVLTATTRSSLLS